MGARSIVLRTGILGAGVWAMATTFASASPWGRDPGSFFLSTRGDYFTARADADDPMATGQIRFERYQTDNYAELGVGWKTTLGAKAVYGTSTFFDGFSAFSASGFSEIEAFAQREILRSDNHVLALRLAGAAPVRFATGARPGFASDGADIDARVLYGRNLMARPIKIFATGEAGYRRRFGSGADQIRVDFLVGVEPSRRILALVDLFSTVSLGAAAPGGADYDIVKVQPSLVWRATKRWSLQAGVTHEAWGGNLLLGDTYFLSLWTQF